MSTAHPPAIDPWLLDLLRCPVTGSPLRLDQHAQGTVLVSTDTANPLVYPVRDGVPVLLADEATPATD